MVISFVASGWTLLGPIWAPARGLYSAPRIPCQSTQNMQTPRRVHMESELFLSGSPCGVRAFYAQTHTLSQTVRAGNPFVQTGTDQD